MKDKTRITVMVCTAACNAKCPLAVVGKPKTNNEYHDHKVIGKIMYLKAGY